jgi:hypothetical protein
MPKLSEECRRRWEEHQCHENDFWAKIEAKYHTKEKRHVECRLCGEMVTRIAPDDVFEALREHEKSHPEYEDWIALGREFSITDLPALLHDHDCTFVKCTCICGCQSSICVADLPENKRNVPMLCELCVLYQGRGHVEHRLPSE